MINIKRMFTRRNGDILRKIMDALEMEHPHERFQVSVGNLVEQRTEQGWEIAPSYDVKKAGRGLFGARTVLQLRGESAQLERYFLEGVEVPYDKETQEPLTVVRYTLTMPEFIPENMRRMLERNGITEYSHQRMVG